MEILAGTKLSGQFKLSSSTKDLHGELTLAGPKTSLYLHDRDFFDAFPKPRRSVTGILLDLTRVTLIDCVTMSGTGTGSRGGEGYHFATLFPHFVLYGDLHIDPEEEVVSAIDMVIDDAATLFYDFDAFGSLIDARPYIDQISRANKLERQIETGPDPQILYFTGKREIFSVKTVLGQISATHNPSHNIGGPEGVHLQNTIVVTIAFDVPVRFEEAMRRTGTISSYLGMIAGRPQNILNLNVRLNTAEDNPPARLSVYWSMPPRREMVHEENRLHPADVLMDAVHEPEAFSVVLAQWLQTNTDRSPARGRFFGCFANQRHYTVERLVAAANMFDILPASAAPVDVELSDEQKKARETARKLFLALPRSAERDSVLGALGRMGKSNLKNKIRYRAKWVIDQADRTFPELALVCDQAVNCRNFYVHGSEAVFDYEAHSTIRSFFTDTLEWVFAASELIEAGWEIGKWLKRGSSMSNQFARYPVTYSQGLSELKQLLGNKLPTEGRGQSGLI